MADSVISKQELIDAQKDAQTLEDAVNGEPGKLIKSRTGREFYSLASVPQINTMTREEVTAAVTPKANKVDVDVALSNLSTTANKYYSTLAAANADIANIALNQSVTIGELANSGLWEKKTAEAVSLTKSPYDPVGQSKEFAINNFNNLTNLNLYRRDRVVNGYYSSQVDGTLQFNEGAVTAYIPVIAGATYYVKSDEFVKAFGISLSDYNYYTTTTLGKVTLNNTIHADVKSFTVPIESTAKYAFINLILPVQLYDITDSLAVSNNLQDVLGVSKINNIEVVDALSRKNLISVSTNADLYSASSNLVDNFYLDGDHVLNSESGWKIASIPVSEGDKLKITAGIFGYPFRAAFFDNNNYSQGSQPVEAVTVTGGNYLYVTAPLGAKYLVVNVYITIVPLFDIRNSLQVVADFERTPDEILQLSGYSIADIYARSLIETYEETVGRFKGKRFLTFGDSITQGTEGGYVGYIANGLGCNLENFGNSGAKANRLQRIMTGQPSRDIATESLVFPVIDYSDVVGITIMIGTNDAGSQIEQPIGSIADIPVGRIENAADTNVYLQSFPNTFFGNLAMCIEYVKWKNPLTEIHLITSPLNVGNSNLMRQMRLYQIEIANYYSINVIDAQIMSGMSVKDMPKFTYDGLHFNALGNQIFGNYVARQLVNG